MDSNPGQRIRELREARGWTQQELESASGVNKATLHSWESGRNAMHFEWLKHRDAATAIASALGVPVEDIWGSATLRGGTPNAVYALPHYSSERRQVASVEPPIKVDVIYLVQGNPCGANHGDIVGCVRGRVPVPGGLYVADENGVCVLTDSAKHPESACLVVWRRVRTGTTGYIDEIDPMGLFPPLRKF